MAHDVYFAYSLKCRKGHDMRMRDFHAVCRDEGEARIDAEIRKRKAELATLLYLFKHTDKAGKPQGRVLQFSDC